MAERFKEAHTLVKEQQMAVRQEEDEELPLFQNCNLVLVRNTRREKGENPKLQQRFVEPYEVVAAFGNHNY